MIRTLDVINSLEYNKKNNIIFVDDNSKFKDQIHQIINVAISAHGVMTMEYPAIESLVLSLVMPFALERDSL